MYRRFLNNIDRLRAAFFYFLRVYRYRLDCTKPYTTTEKMWQLLQSFWRTFIRRTRILFYPEGHRDFHAICKALRFLGYRSTSDPQKKYDFAIKWWLAFDGNPFAPDISFAPLDDLKKKGINVLNIRCNDISKERVNSVFEKIFGYSIAIDPSKYHGKCVMKLNWNALHKGEVVECPFQETREDVVYQKLIRNETEDGSIEDMRVPIFKDKTPFVYLKYRGIKDRLVDREHTNTKVKIAEVADVLSKEELDNIYRFCAEIGMDYGELDVLRDKVDRRIYIVDANNTPSGPPSPISDDEGKVAVVRLAQAFEEVFGG